MYSYGGGYSYGGYGNYGGGSRRKISTLVSFPIHNLDMQPWLRENTGIPAEDCIYDLTAICNHSGSSSGGHYYCYARDDNDGRESWYEYNDSSVFPMSESSLITDNAYVLFYQRRSSALSSATVCANVRALQEEYRREMEKMVKVEKVEIMETVEKVEKEKNMEIEEEEKKRIESKFQLWTSSDSDSSSDEMQRKQPSVLKEDLKEYRLPYDMRANARGEVDSDDLYIYNCLFSRNGEKYVKRLMK